MKHNCETCRLGWWAWSGSRHAELLEDMREDDEIFACSHEKKATETIAPLFCLCFFKAFKKRVEHHTHTPHAPKQPEQGVQSTRAWAQDRSQAVPWHLPGLLCRFIPILRGNRQRKGNMSCNHPPPPPCQQSNQASCRKTQQK